MDLPHPRHKKRFLMSRVLIFPVTAIYDCHASVKTQQNEAKKKKCKNAVVVVQMPCREQRETHAEYLGTLISHFNSKSCHILSSWPLFLASTPHSWCGGHKEREKEKKMLMGIKQKRFRLCAEQGQRTQNKIWHQIFLCTFTLTRDHHKAIVVSKLQSY